MSEQYSYERVEQSISKIKGNDNGYHVYTTRQLYPGDVIEECPAVAVNSKVNDFLVEDSIKDQLLLDKTVPFYDGGDDLRLCLVGGNYMFYRTSENYNAIYQYDPRFGIVTIRAVKKISNTEEILLPSQKQSSNKAPKKGGCGCNKNKNKNQVAGGGRKILDKKPSEKPVPENNATNLFKSMVDGGSLSSIKIEK